MIRRVNKYDRKKPKLEHLVNDAIPFPRLFVLGAKGEKLGVLTKQDAIFKAAENNLDLVVISDNARQPVAKIMDYGKFKYLRKKKRKEAKVKQVTIENKEIRLTPMIGAHDLKVKAKKARSFLLEGHRVKVSLKFRGRELARKELGFDKHKEFFSHLEDIAKVDKDPTMSGRNFLDMHLSRDKTKVIKGAKDEKAKEQKSLEKAH